MRFRFWWERNLHCGYRHALLGVLIVFSAVLSSCGRPAASDAKSEAYRYVTTQYLPTALFAGDRVSFSPFASEEVTVDGDRYTVRGWADATSKWGTRRHRSYTCTVHKAKGGQWEQIEAAVANSE